MGDVVFHHLYGDGVVSALRYDEVGITFGGFDVLEVHGPKDLLVSVDDHLDGASALDDVAVDDADEAFVAIGIDEYFHVEHAAEGWIAQDENAFYDDDVAGFYVYGLGLSGAGEVGICGLFDCFSCLELCQLPDEKFPFDSGGFVEIEFLSFFEGEVAVVAVI